MIDRLNFYDLYGYLVPGVTFVAFLWLPFGRWPDAKWTSAVAVLAVSYAIGHVLHALAGRAIPSKERGADGRYRHFSNMMMDEAGKGMTPALRAKLIKSAKRLFGIDLSDEKKREEGRHAVLEEGRA